MTLAITAALVVAGCQPPISPATQMMSQVELEQQELELGSPTCGETPVHFRKYLHNVLVMANPKITWVDLSAEERERFLKAFNASPPTSSLDGDNVRIYKKDGTKSFFLAITKGPCVVTGHEVSAQLLHHWFKGKEIPTVKTPSKGI